MVYHNEFFLKKFVNLKPMLMLNMSKIKKTSGKIIFCPYFIVDRCHHCAFRINSDRLDGGLRFWNLKQRANHSKKLMIQICDICMYYCK